MRHGHGQGCAGLRFRSLVLRQPDLNEERRGPRADAPEQAIAGFLKGAGIGPISW